MTACELRQDIEAKIHNMDIPISATDAYINGYISGYLQGLSERRVKRPSKRQIYSPAFKSWFGDWEHGEGSVVVEDGKPLIVYHKTDAKFTTFNPDLLGKKSLWGTAYAGFYFMSKNERVAYGKRSMAVYLNIRRPYLIDVKTYADFDYGYKHFDFDNLRTYHDGIIINMSNPIEYMGEFESDRVFVVFYPNQIKSATNNRGSFSNLNNDIRF